MVAMADHNRDQQAATAWSWARLIGAIVLGGYVLVTAYALDPATIFDTTLGRLWGSLGTPQTLIYAALGLGWTALVAALLVGADRLVDHFMTPLPSDVSQRAQHRLPRHATEAMVTLGMWTLVTLTGLFLVFQVVFGLSMTAARLGVDTLVEGTTGWRQFLVVFGMAGAILTALTSAIRMTLARRLTAGG